MSLSAPSAANYGSTYTSTASPAGSTRRGQRGTDALSEEEEKQVEKLKARDSEVRTHEQAHMAAAGGVSVSGPSYSYQQGPDGKRYAVGGHVSIDVSPGRTQEDTLRKAQAIQRAALAPAEPSGQDQAMAAQARQMALQAMAEQAMARHAGNDIEKTYQPQDSTAPALQGRGIDTQA